MKTLARWLGANDDNIKELVFEALRTEGDAYQPQQQQDIIQFTEKPLPDGALPLVEWLDA
jgi:hypothetical protein